MTGNAPLTGPDLLGRFAHALARIIHDERPDLVGRTITVAELYQDIAPYRRMRELAGFEMHADYEHALLRFLAGEGGHAQLDPESAADELGIEAESSDPDLSLYRKFAACDVRLALDGALPPRPPAPRVVEAHPPAAAAAPAPAAEAARSPVAEAAPARTAAAAPGPAAGGVPAKPRPGLDDARTSMRAARCGFCGGDLPDDRDIRFCPHCGTDQTARACASCGEPMEEGWRFCVACGAGAAS